MAKTTGIEWTDKTDNVIRGCSRTCAEGAQQSGCGDGTGGGCYAEEMAGRLVLMGRAEDRPSKYEGLVRQTPTGWRWTGEVRLDEGDLLALIPRRRTPPRRRFINSMSDPFHEALPQHQLDRFWAALLINCRHELGGTTTFQILTKRADRARAYLSDPKTIWRVARAAGGMMEDGDGWHDAIAYDGHNRGLTDRNLWLGVSAEHQAAADERIPQLIGTPAAVRFVSLEPLLGPIDLQTPDHQVVQPDGGMRSRSYLRGVTGDERINWVVAGCESGPRARPADPDWFRQLRDQCKAAGVAYFLKQAVEPPPPHDQPAAMLTGIRHFPGTPAAPCGSHRKGGGVIGLPFLDGEQHAAFPDLPPEPPLEGWRPLEVR